MGRTPGLMVRSFHLAMNSRGPGDEVVMTLKTEKNVVLNSGLTFPSYVTLGPLVNFPVFLFSHL